METNTQYSGAKRGIIWKCAQIGAAIGGCGFLVGLGLSHVDAAFDASFVMIGTVCATLAGVFCAGLFGQPGRKGWAIALAGALLATFFGAWIAGIMFVGGLDQNSLIAPVFVFGTLFQVPPLAALWLAVMAGIHIWARRVWLR